MNYRKICQDRLGNNEYVERVLFEITFNLLHTLGVDRIRFQKLILAFAKNKYLKNLTPKLILAFASLFKLDKNEVLQRSNALDLIKRFRRFKPSMDWRVYIYTSFKTNILQPGLSILKTELTAEKVVGFFKAALQELFELKNTLDHIRDISVLELLEDPNLTAIENHCIYNQDSLVTADYLSGYSGGLRIIRGRGKKPFFGNACSTTKYYLVLLFFGDIVESLESRPQLHEFLNQVMGETNAPKWVNLERNLDRMNLLSEEHKASLA